MKGSSEKANSIGRNAMISKSKPAGTVAKAKPVIETPMSHVSSMINPHSSAKNVYENANSDGVAPVLKPAMHQSKVSDGAVELGTPQNSAKGQKGKLDHKSLYLLQSLPG